MLDILSPPASLLVDQIDTGSLSPAAKQALTNFQNRPEQSQLDALAAQLGPEKAETIARIRLAISADPLEQVRSSVTKMAGSPAQRPLLRMIDDAEGDRDKLRLALEKWFNDEMDRICGWYKRKVQLWIVIYGAVLTIVFNVDTISIAETLWSTPVDQAAASAAAVAAAEKSIAEVPPSPGAIRALSLPIGWTPPHNGAVVSSDPRHFPADFGDFLLKVLGLAITIFALSFGAPFWFDALGKLARLRNAGNTPPK